MNKFSIKNLGKDCQISSFLTRSFFVLIAIGIYVSGYAQINYTSNGSGNWNTATSWTPNGIPGANDNVTINGGSTITLNFNNQSVNNITINAGATLQFNSSGLTVNGNWVNNGGNINYNCACNANTVTMTGNGTSIGGTSATTFDYLTINTTGKVSLITSGLTIPNQGILTLQSGIFKVGAGNSINMSTGQSATITAVNGNFANSLDGQGDADADGGTINAAETSGGSLTVNGNVTFNNIKSTGDGNWNFQINNSGTRINGALTETGSGNQWRVSGNSPIWGPSSSLYIDENNNGITNADIGGLAWVPIAPGAGTIGVTPGYPNNVTLTDLGSSVNNGTGWAPSGSLSLNGTLQLGDGITTARATFANLTSFSSGGIKLVDNPAKAPATTELIAPPTGVNFTDNGNFTTDATSIFDSNGGTITFSGSGTQASPQTISTVAGSTVPFNNVVVSNNTYVQLQNSVSVAGTLNLTSGIIGTTATDSLLISSFATNALTGGSATSYVNGRLSWVIAATSTNSYSFPVGAGSGASATYLPLVLSPNTTAGAVVTVQAFNTGSGGTPGPTVTSLSPTEYWSLSSTSNFTNGASVKVTRPTTVGANNALAESYSPTGTYVAIGGTPSGNSISGGSIGNATPVYISMVVAPLSAVQVSSTNVTCNGTVGSITVGGSGGTQPYSFSIDGGAFQGPEATATFINLTPGSHTVTVKDNTGTTASTTMTVLGSLQINGGADTVKICPGSSAALNAVNLLNTTPMYSWAAIPAGATAGLPAAAATTSAANASISVTPAVNTQYIVTSTLYNNDLLTNPSFESGNSGFQTDFTAPPAGTAPYQNTPGADADGYYLITSNPDNLCQYFTINNVIGGPTATAEDGTLLMAFDGPANSATKRPWYETITGLTVGNVYKFNYWYREADPANTYPQLQVSATNGTIVAIGATPGTTITVNNAAQWTQATYTFTATGTSTTIALTDVINTGTNGNDGLLDNFQFLAPCVVTDTITVTVGNAALAGTVSPAKQTICSGGTPSNPITLSGNTNSIIRWEYSTDKTFITNVKTITPTPAGSTTLPAVTIAALGLTDTTYFHAVVNGCTAGTTISTDSVLIIVLSANPPKATDTFICAGSSATLTVISSGSASDVINWYSDAGLTNRVNIGASYPNISITSTTTYYITESNGTCTSNDTTLTVTVNASPSVNGNHSVCVGSTLTLTGTGTPASSNTWQSTTALLAKVNNNGLVTGLMSGNAEIVYTNNSGCTDTVTLTVNGLPTITPANPSVCVGNTVSLTGSATAAINAWAASNTFAGVNNSGMVTGNTAGRDSVFYTNANGCADTAVVTINGLPSIGGTLAVSVGLTTQLSVTPVVNGLWSSLNNSIATVNSLSGLVSGVANGKDSIVFTNTSGCADTVVVTVTSNPVISGDSTVCIGSNTQLAGSGTPAASSPWVSSNIAVATISNTGYITTLSAGTSTITYTNSNGKDTTTTLTVNALPTVIPANPSVCISGSISLTGSATAASSNAWQSLSPSVAAVNNSTGVVTGSTGGSSKIIYTNNNGCADTVTVTVNPLPSVSGVQAVCAGSTIQLTGSATAGTDAWQSLTTTIATIDNNGQVTGVSGGNSKIVYTNNNGCTDTVAVTVNGLPAAPTGIPASRCGTGEVMLGATPSTAGDLITWYSDISLSTAAATGTSYTTPNISSPGAEYYITEKNSNGCISSPAVQVTATVSAGPTPPSGVGASRCGPGVVTLTATINGNISDVINWYSDPGLSMPVSGNPQSSYSPNVNDTTYYYITEVNTANCASTPVQVAAIVNPIPMPPNVTNTSICGTGSATLGASLSGASTDVLNWYTDQGLLMPITPEPGQSYNTPVIDTTTSYYVTESSVNLCVSTASTVTAIVNPVPSAPIGVDSSRCGGGVVVLEATPSADASDIITWYSDAGLGNQLATGIVFNTPAISSTMAYYATETSDSNCASVTATPVTATILPQPTVTFTALKPVCQEVPEFALTGGAQTSGLPGSYTYTGIGVINDSAFNPQQSGPGAFPITYTYTASNGCFADTTQTITVYPAPVVSYGGVQSVLAGDSITLQPQTQDIGLSYVWSPAIYLNTDTSAMPVCKPADSVTYTIMFTSPGGCSSSITLLVQVLNDFMVPNTFTPNNDGINDTWVIAELPKYPIQWVQVFDRYGQLLYESHGYSTPWDGTYKGHQLPAGTYYYIIELGGLVSPKTGYVTILR